MYPNEVEANQPVIVPVIPAPISEITATVGITITEGISATAGLTTTTIISPTEQNP